MEAAIWKEVPDLNGFKASTSGQIKKIYPSGKERLLSQYPKKYALGSRYLLVKMNYKEVKVSHVIYKTFKGEIPAGMSIVHKNGDIYDNSINNLIALSKQQVGRMYGGHTNKRKPVAQFDRRGNMLQVFPSVRAAARATGISYTSISDNCYNKGGYLAADGYRYEWDDLIEY